MSCSYPGYVENAKKIGLLYSFPHYVRFECNDGYELIGPDKIYCSPKGNWIPSIERIKCVPKVITCSKPYPNAPKSLYDINDIVVYTCPKTKLDIVAKCMKDGTWYRNLALTNSNKNVGTIDDCFDDKHNFNISNSNNKINNQNNNTINNISNIHSRNNSITNINKPNNNINPHNYRTKNLHPTINLNIFKYILFFTILIIVICFLMIFLIRL